MKAIILGGFLGAGKTTVLLRLVPWLVGHTAERENGCPVVVLENEISLTDIDARRLRDEGLTVRNLTAGCICCTSRGSLMEAVEKIHEEYAPEYLVVEATGMAYPDSVKETLLSTDGVDSVKILGIADVSRWKKLLHAMPDFVRGQLCQADVVLMNKTDLVEPEVVDDVKKSVRTFTQTAEIYEVSAKDSIPEHCFAHLL